MYKIEIYRDKNGKSEIANYLELLKNRKDKNNKAKREKILAYMRLLQEKGLSLGEPHIKHLDNEIWELRPLRDRILFASFNNNKFILLNIFMKQTRKTPHREIEKAKRLLKDYEKRSAIKMSKFQTWDEFEKELNITPEEEAEIQFEMALIRAEIEARKSQNMTQEELSKKSGINQPSIARIENRTHSPTASTLIRLLYPLGYTLAVVPIKKIKKQ